MDQYINESKNPLIPLPTEIQKTVDRINQTQQSAQINPFDLSDSHKKYQDNNSVLLPKKKSEF